MQTEATRKQGQQYGYQTKQALNKIITKDRECHYIMIKRSIPEEDIILINIYTLNTGTPKFTNQN